MFILQKPVKNAIYLDMSEKANTGGLRLRSAVDRMLIDTDKKPSSAGMRGKPDERLSDILDQDYRFRPSSFE